MNLASRSAITALLLLCSSAAWGEEPHIFPPAAVEKAASEPAPPEVALQAGVAGYLRGMGTENFAIGDSAFAPAVRDRLLTGRIQPYLYWKPLDSLSGRVELQGYWNRDNRNLDDFRANLYQAYVDVSAPTSLAASVRAGRQELVYGSGFILSNDPFNDGLSYDALRLQLKPAPSLTIDLLWGKYASLYVDRTKGDLSGIYATYALNDDTAVDLYSFRDTGSQDGISSLPLYIWGTRLTTKYGPVSVELEPVYESGSLRNDLGGSDDIDAYGGHLDLTLENQWQGFKNKLCLGYAVGSGSREAADGTRFNKEFRHPNSNASFSEQISVVGDLSGLDAGDSRASGIQSYSLAFGSDLPGDLNFTVANHLFKAMEVPQGFSKEIGFETTAYLSWQPVDSLSLVLAYTHLFSGAFFRDATGSDKDVDIGYVMAQFDISMKKTK